MLARTSLWMPPVLLALALTACDTGDKGSTSDTDLTSDTDEVTYESGCILVDNSGGYANLQDAITVAGDGSTIQLCGSIMEETVLVEGKTLTIEGDSDTWAAPTNKVALEVVDGDVTLSNVTISSTRSAISIDGGALTLTDVSISEAGGRAVYAADADVVIENGDFSNCADGGVVLEGGTLELTQTTISSIQGNAVWLTDATATLANNLIEYVELAGDGTDIYDGWSILGQSGVTLTMSGNEIYGGLQENGTSGLFGGIFLPDGGSLVMADDVLTDVYYGIVAFEADATLERVQILDHYYTGILLADATVEFTDVDVITDPEWAAPATGLGEWDGSVGIRLEGVSATFSGGSSVGSNTAGLFVIPSADNDTELTANGLLIDDNAGFGMFVQESDVAFVDVDVTNTRDDDDNCLDSSSYSCNMAAWLYSANVTWTGGSLAGSSTIGALVYDSVLTVTGAEISGAGLYAIWNYDGVSTFSDTLFDGNAYGIVSNSGSITVDESTFSNGEYTQIYENSDGSFTYYYYNGWDINISDTVCEVTDTTFVDGESGILGSDSAITVENSTFDGYNRNAIYASTDADITVADVSFTDSGTNAIYCYGAEVTVDDVTISQGGEYAYLYESYSAKGELLSQTSYDFTGPTVYLYGCDGQFEGLEIEDTSYFAIQLYDVGDVSFDETVLTDVNQTGSGAIYGYNYNGDMSVEFTDLTISDVASGNGVYLFGNSSDPETYPTEFTFEGLTIGQPDGDDGVYSNGIYASYINDLKVTGFDIHSTGSAGIYLSYSTATLTGSSEDFANTGTIGGAGTYGIYASNSEMELTGVTIEESGLSGIYLNDGTHDIVGNTVIDAGTYGMECAGGDEEFTSCSNSLSGASGANSGCPSSCDDSFVDTGDTGL